MAFDDDFLRRLRERSSIARYASRKLAFDPRKSQPARGDYWACCPFHGEKTPSFHVLDVRGLYKCFGCGEKGDIFSLAMKLEGLSFREAVERIAADNGVPMPEENDPKAREKADQRQRLVAAMEAARDAYRAALNGPEGAQARDYLAKRGLGDPAVQGAFGLGWAPSGWTWLAERLGKRFALEDLIAAGLVKAGEPAKRPFDFFRGRLMVPIEDAQGRVIAFGGRLIGDGDGPKYLNSLDTPLFSKSRTLYRLGPARALAAKTKAPGLVVAEGYFDVVALERAGVAAVAPLGTALTEDQLDLVWRSGGTPILCFDGDEAGKRAAWRAIDLALPKLAPDRTLRIALLPQGQDPDDLFRREGPQAVTAALEQAIPLIDALYAREEAARPLDTPEARAGLKQRLLDAAGKIAHEGVRREYMRELSDRVFNRFRRPPTNLGLSGKGRDRGRRGPPAPSASAELKQALHDRNRSGAIEGLLRLAIDMPALLEQGAERLADLAIADSDLDRVRHAALDLVAAGEKVDREHVKRHLHSSGETAAAQRIARWPAPVATGEAEQRALEKAAEAQWMALLGLVLMSPAVGAEVAAAGARPDGRLDDDEFARLAEQIRARRDRAADALRFGDGAASEP